MKSSRGAASRPNGYPADTTVLLWHPTAMPVLCDEIMTKDVQACTASEPVRHAAELMAERHVGSLPVTSGAESRTLVGIITDRDIVLRVVAAGRNADETTVGDTMTTDLITCRPSDNVDEAVDRMMMHQIRRIYVVTPAGDLAGVIAQADVASRYGDRQKTAQMVERVSQPEADQPVSKD